MRYPQDPQLAIELCMHQRLQNRAGSRLPLGEHFANNLNMNADEFEQAQDIVDYWTAQHTIRSSSWLSLALATLILLAGFGSSLNRPPGVAITIAMITAGGVIVSAVAKLVWPHPYLFLIEGVLLLVTSLAIGWGMTSGQLDNHLESAALGSGIAGLFAFWRLKRYPQYLSIWATKPESEQLQFMERVVKDISEADAEHRDDIIEFWIGGLESFGPPSYWSKATQCSYWKGGLAKLCAVFIKQDSLEISVTPRMLVQIATYGSSTITPFGVTLFCCQMRVADQVFDDVSISSKCLLRSQNWTAASE